jgi:hypothetical protein
MIHIVKVAKVTDPKTGETVTVSFDEGCQVIFLDCGKESFGAEAYHLESWAKDHGLELVIKSFELKI